MQKDWEIGLGVVADVFFLQFCQKKILDWECFGYSWRCSYSIAIVNMYLQHSVSESRPTMILYGIDNIRDLFGPKVPVLYCCDENISLVYCV